MDRRVGQATGHRKKKRNSLSWPHYPLSSAYPSQGEPTQPEIVPLTGKGKAGYVISYFRLLGLCVRNPLCLCPTQRLAELSWATEMAGARKKSKNSPINQVPGDNPSSHWPALQRTQRLLSLRKLTSLEQPLWNHYQFHLFSPLSLACYWSLQMISSWVPSPRNPPLPPHLPWKESRICGGDQPRPLGLGKGKAHLPRECSGPAPRVVTLNGPSPGATAVCASAVTPCYPSSGLWQPGPPGFGSVSSHWPALLGSSAALLAFPLGTYTLPVRNLSQQGLHYHLCPQG